MPNEQENSLQWVVAALLRRRVPKRGLGPLAVATLVAGVAGHVRVPRLDAQGTGRIQWNGFSTNDLYLARKLEQLADHAGWIINVTSGTRTQVPPGGSSTSLHLRGRAVDFRVVGRSDAQIFDHLRGCPHVRINYEVIWHAPATATSPGTATSGPHVHLGRNGDGKPSEFYVERGGSYRPVKPHTR
jgi:hypothetical protein